MAAIIQDLNHPPQESNVGDLVGSDFGGTHCVTVGIAARLGSVAQTSSKISLCNGARGIEVLNGTCNSSHTD